MTAVWLALSSAEPSRLGLHTNPELKKRAGEEALHLLEMVGDNKSALLMLDTRYGKMAEEESG